MEMKLPVRSLVEQVPQVDFFVKIWRLFEFPTSVSSSASDKLVVTYKDEEDDIVTISSDDDVKDAINLLSKGGVRLHLSLKAKRESCTEEISETSLREKRGPAFIIKKCRK